MFEQRLDQLPAAGRPVVRVPFAALAARPRGVEVALQVGQLITLLTDDHPATADGPGTDVPPDEAVRVERDLVDEIGAAERMKARTEAAQISAIAELAGRPMFAGCAEHGHDDPAHGVRGAASVVSAELRLSPAAAVARVALACELVAELPATLAELSAGGIDGYRARVIAEQTRPLAGAPGLRRSVEATMLATAHRKTATQLRAAVTKAVIAADPANAQQRHRRARAGRFVSAPCPEPDGMASLLLRMPAEDAAAFWTAIDAAARRQQNADPGDKRTLDQARADVLAGLGWSALTAGHLGCCHPDCSHINSRLGARRGKAACVNVTVAYTTLIGADDQPAHLHGHGPITAEAARRIAAHGVWRRILTDPALGCGPRPRPPAVPAAAGAGRARHRP
ncbi:MAG TPA: DUF222 domain-containing protein, partial [Jiangellaceae bacterium]|nr:DUF222 domain-containing protein [Jiangellaceae bacterium]